MRTKHFFCCIFRVQSSMNMMRERNAKTVRRHVPDISRTSGGKFLIRKVKYIYVTNFEWIVCRFHWIYLFCLKCFVFAIKMRSCLKVHSFRCFMVMSSKRGAIRIFIVINLRMIKNIRLFIFWLRISISTPSCHQMTLRRIFDKNDCSSCF